MKEKPETMTEAIRNFQNALDDLLLDLTPTGLARTNPTAWATLVNALSGDRPPNRDDHVIDSRHGR